MKKIMFDDRHGLTKAVLEGRTTMTRRIILEIPPISINGKLEPVVPLHIEHGRLVLGKEDGSLLLYAPSYLDPKYKVGEVVAVAQSYKSIHDEMMAGDYGSDIYDSFRWAYVADSPGWGNKMFVRADLMPHQIRITDVRVERLQDISDEECLREGVFLDETAPSCYQPFYTFPGSIYHDTPVGYKTPREAFAALIDEVLGKGTWKSNPWVFVYEFSLVEKLCQQ